MPGYGYAAAAKAKVAAWTALIHTYLRGRANLKRVYVLVDARRGLTAADDEVLETLDSAAVSYQIVLTKADEVKPGELAACLDATGTALSKHPAAFPQALVTSARSGAGIPELRAAIARLAGGAAAVRQPDAARETWMVLEWSFKVKAFASEREQRSAMTSALLILACLMGAGGVGAGSRSRPRDARIWAR